MQNKRLNMWLLKRRTTGKRKMAFNSDTFRANKARREAWNYLDEARDIKARVKTGEAYDWEEGRIATKVKLARLHMHDHLCWKRIRELSKQKRA